MATVTGTLNDVSLGHLVGKSPEVMFRLADPATSAAGLFVTEPITATPTASGAFSVNLEPTETMHQQRHYELSVRWLDAAGNFIKVDFPDWKLFVPSSGGTLADLITGYADNPFLIFWGVTEPDPWPVGTLWVDTSVDTPTSGNVYRRNR